MKLKSEVLDQSTSNQQVFIEYILHANFRTSFRANTRTALFLIAIFSKQKTLKTNALNYTALGLLMKGCPLYFQFKKQVMNPFL